MFDVKSTIRKYQNQRNWTDYQMSERSGIPQTTISAWFAKGSVPTTQSIEKLCDAFNITLSQFFAQGDEPVTLTPFQKVFLDRLNCLSPEKQKALFQFMDSK